jgi:hypothetical protein
VCAPRICTPPHRRAPPPPLLCCRGACDFYSLEAHPARPAPIDRQRRHTTPETTREMTTRRTLCVLAVGSRRPLARGARRREGRRTRALWHLAYYLHVPVISAHICICSASHSIVAIITIQGCVESSILIILPGTPRSILIILPGTPRGQVPARAALGVILGLGLWSSAAQVPRGRLGLSGPKTKQEKKSPEIGSLLDAAAA